MVEADAFGHRRSISTPETNGRRDQNPLFESDMPEEPGTELCVEIQIDMIGIGRRTAKEIIQAVVIGSKICVDRSHLS